MIKNNPDKFVSNFSSVNKEIKRFAHNISKSADFEIDSSTINYIKFFENKMLIIHAIRNGLPYQLFNSIKEITPFSEEDWADYLDISIKSLKRYSSNPKFLFKSIHSEKIIELAEVSIFGEEVFDSKDQFYLWLNTPSFALANQKPLALLKDSYGKELVMAELNRIEHGIFA